MDIQVLPIMVNKDGSFSLLVKASDDQKQYGLLSFSHDEIPDDQTILDNLPKELGAEGTSTKIGHLQNVVNSESAAYFVLIGNETDFSNLPPTPESKWFKQNQLKFGMLPDGVETVNDVPNLYTGSLSPSDRFVVVAGVHATRALRAGVNTESDSMAADFGFLRLVAEDDPLVAQIMDAKRDAAFPQLSDDGTKAKPSVWTNYKRIFTNIAAIAAMRAADRLTENKPAVDAKRSEAALEARKKGSDPKPA